MCARLCASLHLLSLAYPFTIPSFTLPHAGAPSDGYRGPAFRSEEDRQKEEEEKERAKWRSRAGKVEEKHVDFEEAAYGECYPMQVSKRAEAAREEAVGALGEKDVLCFSALVPPSSLLSVPTPYPLHVCISHTLPSLARPALLGRLWTATKTPFRPPGSVPTPYPLHVCISHTLPSPTQAGFAGEIVDSDEEGKAPMDDGPDGKKGKSR